MIMNALLFGAGGSLGSAIYSTLGEQGFELYTAGSKKSADSTKHIQLEYEQEISPSKFSHLPFLDAVIWSQGLNCNDSINDFRIDTMNSLWEANVAFIASSLSILLEAEKINAGSRLCIVSSIWQLEARSGKLSYSITKSALQGLIKSCALDLGKQGILINGVLPGVVDTPMTRRNLSSKQIDAIQEQSALNRLPEPIDIAEAVSFLIGPKNSSITGQFLIVDCGFVGLKNF